VSLQTRSAKRVNKVLVTDGSYPSAVGIMRHLAKEGLVSYAISPSKRALASYSKYCKKCFLSPSPLEEEKYVSFIANLIDQNDIDMLVPVGYQNCYVFSKYQDELKKIVKLEVPDFKSIEIALNKKKTYELSQKIGVPYPKTVYPNETSEIEYLADQIGYPLIIKGLFEAGKNIVSFVENKNELEREYNRICKENGFTSGSLPMLQEFIPGQNTDFVTINLLYQNGTCKRIFLQRRIRNHKGLGTATCCDCKISPSVSEQMKVNAKSLLNALNWNGVACIEFKRDPRDGIVKLIEINPKFWASTEMSLIAGVNFPYHLCEMADGKLLDYSEKYDYDLRFHYSLSSDLLQLRWNPRSIPEYISDCLNPRTKSDVCIRDLKPNIVQFGSTLLRFIGSLSPR
jgi:predicted ATP-grasp superfamily ATP-dependent carboligase